MKIFSFSLLLFVLWVLLSGYFTPLLLGLGVISVLLTLFLGHRMNVIDHESYPIHMLSKFPAFFVYIMWEIVKANIDVIKRILNLGDKQISPQMIEIPAPQKTALGRVIYANAITLTPGTVSVALDDNKIIVHTLSKEGADDLLSGEMAKKIPDQAMNQ